MPALEAVGQMTDPAVVRTESLTKRYGRLRALDRLTLQVRAGEVLGFLGPNGAGKTTTLRLLMGFLRPTAGSARVHGLDAWRDRVAVHARTGTCRGMCGCGRG
jgi:ABC-type multidrug transport system ATPase subunit